MTIENAVSNRRTRVKNVKNWSQLIEINDVVSLVFAKVLNVNMLFFGGKL